MGVTRIRENKRENGLDFFSAMPDQLQQKFETVSASGMCSFMIAFLSAFTNIVPSGCRLTLCNRKAGVNACCNSV